MSLILRQVKGEKLTIVEMDDNLTYLEDLASSNSGSNYAQTVGSQSTTINAGATGSIVSVSITVNDHPVLVTVTGDANNTSASASFCRLQLHRDGTAIGNVIQCESSAFNENNPYSISYVDEPGDGTFTYTLEAISVSGSDFQFGEVDGPVIIAIELVTGGGDNWNESDNSVVDSTRSNVKGGECNVIYCSVNSTIIGGNSNEICGSGSVCDSGIFGGCRNIICGSVDYSAIVGGAYNCLYSSDYSGILSGYCNCITQNSDCSTIVGGAYSYICNNSCNSSIIAGRNNCIEDYSCNSTILGGSFSCITYNSCNSSIIGSFDSCMCLNVKNSSIISGDDHCMSGGCSTFYEGSPSYTTFCTTGFITASSMLAGCNNKMLNDITNSVILGGRNNHICGTVCQVSANNSYCCTTCDSAIMSSKNSTIQNSNQSGIISSCGTLVSGSYYSSIINSTGIYDLGVGYNIPSVLYNSNRSSIISSYVAGIADANSSVLLGTEQYSYICNSNTSVIIAANEGAICFSQQSAIIGGCYNNIDYSNRSTIIGSICSCVVGSTGSMIIGGSCNEIINTDDVILIPTLTTSTFSAGNFDKWKLGKTASGNVTLDAEQYIEVEINGIVYKLGVVSE